MARSLPLRLSFPLLTGLVAALAGSAAGQAHAWRVDAHNVHRWIDSASTYSFGNGALSGLGDLDEDGHPEVLIGKPVYTRATAGLAQVYSGRTGKLLATVTDAQAGTTFGFSCASIGDTNGDSVPDFAVGEPSAKVGTFAGAGRVRIYSGKLQGGKFALIKVLDGGAAGAAFGWSLAGPGDVDGDGVRDLAVGAPGDGSTSKGSVFVYSGNATQGFKLLTRRDGVQAGERFGEAVAGAGDLDGDRRADVVIGAPRWDGSVGADQGRAEALLATASGWRTLAVGAGVGAGDRYGNSVSRVGRVSDTPRVAVGAPGHSPTAALAGAGHVSVVAPTKPWILPVGFAGTQAGERLGERVAAVGDVDCDGVADFAASAPLWDLPGPATHRDAGRVVLFSAATKKPVRQVHRGHFRGCSSTRFGLRYGSELVAAGDVDQDDHVDLLVGCNSLFLSGTFGRCNNWTRDSRRVFVDSTRPMTLFADRAHAFTCKEQVTISYSFRGGAAAQNQLVLFLGTGPQANAKATIPIGKFRVPVDPTSPWFGFVLSGAFGAPVRALDSKGNATVLLSFPKIPSCLAAPLRVYHTALVIRWPAPGLTPLAVSNDVRLTIR